MKQNTNDQSDDKFSFGGLLTWLARVYYQVKQRLFGFPKRLELEIKVENPLKRVRVIDLHPPFEFSFKEEAQNETRTYEQIVESIQKVRGKNIE